MPSDDLVAFVDESRKPVRHVGRQLGASRGSSFYAVSAVILLRDDVDGVRRKLRDLAGLTPHGLHYRKLASAVRRDCVYDINTMTEWDAIVVETNRAVPVRNDRQIRAAVLQSAFTTLWRVHGVREVVLESRAMITGQFARLDRDDELVAAHLRTVRVLPDDFDIAHGSKSDPALGLADLVVGARTDHLCGVDYGPWSLIAHRVRTLQVPPRHRPSQDAEAPGR